MDLSSRKDQTKSLKALKAQVASLQSSLKGCVERAEKAEAEAKVRG